MTKFIPSLKVFSLDVLKTKFDHSLLVVPLPSDYIQNKPPTVKYVCVLCVMCIKKCHEGISSNEVKVI